MKLKIRQRNWKVITIKSTLSKLMSLFNIKINKIYPKSFERFALKEGDLIGAEIGVYRGKHAKSMLRTGKVNKLYLIDSYKYLEGSDDLVMKDLDKAKEKAFDLLKDENVEFIYKFSKDAANKIPDELDFIYLDGGHSYETVREDIKLYWDKIKIGGVLGGDDILNGRGGYNNNDGVVQAVIEFVVNNNLNLKIEGFDWWIIKNEKQ